MGFAHAWTYDHLAWGDLRDGPWYGAIPYLAGAATVTDRVRLGPLVSSPNFRHPVALAREVTALDDLSEGRLTLGIGAGGRGWDATILGQEPWTPAERAGRYSEFVEVLDALLAKKSLDFEGHYYSARGARSLPGCRQQPRVPFLLAANGPRAMATVARFGQGWVTTGTPDDAGAGPVIGADQLRRMGQALDEAGEAAGRPTDQVDRMVLLGPVLDQGLESAQAFADTVGAYEEAGATDVVIHWPRPSPPYQGDRAGFERAVLGLLGS